MHSSELWWPAFTIAANVLTWAVTRWVERTRIQRRRAMMRPWQVRLENNVREYMDALLHVSELEMDLAYLIQDMPKEFTPAVFEAMQLGRTIPRAVLKEARRRGLLHVELERAIPAAERTAIEAAVAADGTTSGAPISQPVPAAEPRLDEARGTRRWRDGKIMPISAAKTR